MMCDPCKGAGDIARENPTAAEALHMLCENPNCTCQHRIPK